MNYKLLIIILLLILIAITIYVLDNVLNKSEDFLNKKKKKKNKKKSSDKEESDKEESEIVDLDADDDIEKFKKGGNDLTVVLDIFDKINNTFKSVNKKIKNFDI